MNVVRLLLLHIIAVFVLASGSALVSARDDEAAAEKRARSHLPITPADGQSQDPEAVFSDRLGKLRAMRDARKLAEQMLKNKDIKLTEEDVKRLQEKLGQSGGTSLDLNDPVVQALLSKLLEQQQQKGSAALSELGMDAKQLEGIRERLTPPQTTDPPADEPLLPKRPRINPHGLPDPTLGAPGPPNEGGNGGGDNRASARVQEPSRAEQELRSPEGSEARAKFAEQLAKFAGRVKGMDATLRNSPALNQALRDLTRSEGTPDERWLELVNRLGNWGEWAPRLKIERTPEGDNPLAERVAASLSKLGDRRGPLDKLSGITGPRITPPESSREDGWAPLALGMTLAVFGGLAFLWTMRMRNRRHAADARQAAWRPGAWPVHPAAVRTRQDLIRAFEYLSLLCLGPSARQRNHLELATRLGEEARPDFGNTWLSPEERRFAATHLASLYERARYAPPTDPWPEAELSTARRDICSLAGVAAV